MDYDKVEIKLVAVGDGAVGKTCLLMSYAYNKFPVDYVPTVFDNYSIDLLLDGRQVRLGLWDTAGQEDYDLLRPLSYQTTDIFLVCFSLVRRGSLSNVELKWIPELRYHSKKVPILLVGLQKDLRDEDKTGQESVPYQYAKTVAAKVGAVAYLECSAKTMEGVHNVFNEAMRAVVNPASFRSQNSSGFGSMCLIL